MRIGEWRESGVLSGAWSVKVSVECGVTVNSVLSGVKSGLSIMNCRLRRLSIECGQWSVGCQGGWLQTVDCGKVSRNRVDCRVETVKCGLCVVNCAVWSVSCAVCYAE
jgi:hypothetical protein